MQVLMHIFKKERLLCHYYTHLIKKNDPFTTMKIDNFCC